MRTRCLLVLLLGSLVVLSSCSWLLEDTISVDPAQGAVHTLVTVRGRGFGDEQGTGHVAIWATYADIVSWSDTKIVCRVPVIPTPDGLPVETYLSVDAPDADRYYYESTAFTVVRGILFQTDREGDYEVYVMNPDGSCQTNLSRNYAQDKEPCWSPDGTRVAFEADIAGRETDLRVMAADGGGRAALTDSPYHIDGEPRWSPDGSRIVFYSEWDLSPEIWTVRPDGTGHVQLTDFDIIGVFSPCWSPDGSQVAFSASEGLTENDLRIVVMSADGSGATYITDVGHGDSEPSWSPDGQWIAFSRNRTDEGDGALMAVRPDGTNLVRLTGPAMARPAAPSWSPDGSGIVFSASLNGLGPHDIFLLDLDAETVYQLTNDPDVDASPFWGT